MQGGTPRNQLETSSQKTTMVSKEINNLVVIVREKLEFRAQKSGVALVNFIGFQSCQKH